MLAWYAGKANVSLSFAVVVSVCHLYRLVSRITRPSYKKDVQQMSACDKSSVNGTNGSEPVAIKWHPPRAIESRHQNGHSQRVAPLAVRPKNGAVRCTVLPSVELQAAPLCQGRILKPRNKSARQNGPRKGVTPRASKRKGGEQWRTRTQKLQSRITAA